MPKAEASYQSKVKAGSSNLPRKERLYFLDWARVFAFSLLIVYHTGLIFVIWPWHIKSEVRSEAIAHLLNFITQWRIPLLFFVSGAGAGLMYKGNYLGFLRGRLERILIPFCVAVVCILPWQYMLERVWQGAPAEIVLNNPWSYFMGSFGFLSGSDSKGNFNLYHLWYLWDLWKMLVILVPALYLADKQFGKWMDVKAVRAGLLGLAFAVQILLKAAPAFDYVYFGVLFSIGFLVFRHFSKFNFGYLWQAVGLGTIAYTVLLVVFWKFEYTSMPPQIRDSDGMKWAFRFFLELNTATWIYVVLAVFRRYCDRFNKRVVWLNRIILPIYILHQLLIMVLGYLILPFRLPPVAGFLLIQALFWPLVLMICSGILARFKLTRLLIGIREVSTAS